MANRVEELLERGVIALEKLVEEEMELRVETKPPVCPHCGVINPKVRTEIQVGDGNLAEFCAQVFCLNCHNTFFMVPLQSENVKTKAELKEVIEERVSLGNFKRNGIDEH